MTLASCDAEDGESKINEWLVGRSDEQAAAELIAAAATGTPGLRGAAFAVLDRIGKAATEEVRAALERAAAARARGGLAARARRGRRAGPG